MGRTYTGQWVEKRAEARVCGELHFFTGIPCVRGHIAKRFVSSGGCFECHILKSRDYSKNHPEKRRETGRRWQAKNKDISRRNHKAWMTANHDRWKKYHREYSKAWAKAHPLGRRICLIRRRARIANSNGRHTAADIETLKIKQRGLCYWCRKAWGDKFHVDHIWPLSRGGSNGIENIVLTCPLCNTTKRAKTPMEFAGRLF